MPWKRLFGTLLLISSLLFAPFFVTLILFALFLYFFDYYAEGVFLFFLADLSYGIPLQRFFDFPYVMTAIALALFLASLLIKPYLLKQ